MGSISKRIILAVLFSSISPNFSHATVQQGLVGWWRMDEGTGTSTTADSSVNGNAGTLNAAPTWTNNCPRNNCLSFNASNQYVSVANASGLVTNSNMTLSCWAEIPNSPGNFGGICGIRNNDSDTAFYILQLSGTNNLEERFRNSTGALYQNIVGITPNVWNHLVLVYDGSTLYSYVNGVLNTSTPASGVFTNGGISLLIAASGIGGITDFFGGPVDDVRLYNRALSADEIMMLYQPGVQIKNAVIKNAHINQ